ncbi:MAG: hypothetical protein ABI565_09575, partial [Vicinamibacteria bacterium]
EEHRSGRTAGEDGTLAAQARMAASIKRTGLPVTLFLGAVVALPLAVAPTMIRGLAADAWVSHYAALETLPRPHKLAARAVASRVCAAVMNLAPLPEASAAALRALEIGARTEHQDHDREAALLIYQGVRNACARVRSRPFAGPGFAVIEARAAALQDASQAGVSK